MMTMMLVLKKMMTGPSRTVANQQPMACFLDQGYTWIHGLVGVCYTLWLLKQQKLWGCTQFCFLQVAMLDPLVGNPFRTFCLPSHPLCSCLVFHSWPSTVITLITFKVVLVIRKQCSSWNTKEER